jgi:hypothetical protein
MRLLETEYCTIDVDPTGTLVHFTRSELPYRSIADIEREASRIETALQGFGGGRRLLADLRAVPPRNDPDFEEAISKVRQSLYTNVVRVALLVRTAIGALQTMRHARHDGVFAQTYEDESLALAWLELDSLRPSASRTDERAPPPNDASTPFPSRNLRPSVIPERAPPGRRWPSAAPTVPPPDRPSAAPTVPPPDRPSVAPMWPPPDRPSAALTVPPPDQPDGVAADRGSAPAVFFRAPRRSSEGTSRGSPRDPRRSGSASRSRRSSRS